MEIAFNIASILVLGIIIYEGRNAKEHLKWSKVRIVSILLSGMLLVTGVFIVGQHLNSTKIFGTFMVALKLMLTIGVLGWILVRGFEKLVPR